jgi:hypothetical protein
MSTVWGFSRPSRQVTEVAIPGVTENEKLMNGGHAGPADEIWVKL